MVVDAPWTGSLKAIPQLSEIVGPFAGSDSNEGTVFHRKWINHEFLSCKQSYE